MDWNNNIKVSNEDNMALMARYPDNYFDLAIVDPPYGIGMGGSLNVNSKTNFKSKKWDSETPKQEYFNELIRVSKVQIVWGWNYMTNKLPPSKSFIYWDKMNHHDNRSDGELAYCSDNGLGRCFKYMWDGNRYGFEGNIQGVGKPTIRIHPTQKPVALYKWLLDNYAKEGDKILDTHLGSGSIALACHDYKFDLTACELDTDYYNSAYKRFKEHSAQQALF
jgi:site-specific DNA-methyltransferase (adenine-specific)